MTPSNSCTVHTGAPRRRARCDSVRTDTGQSDMHAPLLEKLAWQCHRLCLVQPPTNPTCTQQPLANGKHGPLPRTFNSEVGTSELLQAAATPAGVLRLHRELQA